MPDRTIHVMQDALPALHINIHNTKLYRGRHRDGE